MELASWVPMVITTMVLIGVLIVCTRDKLQPHLAALCAMAILLAAGIISTKEALSVFSNTAPLTIACMCIISAALERTGIIGWIAERMIASAQRTKSLTMLVFLIGVMGISAFMNNTPLVIIMTPVVIALARSLNDAPSYYLIPLSYAAILGGTCTLVGTSTNILVDSVAQEYGQPAFSMFEISRAGILIAIAGALFMALFARRLLPNRPLPDEEIAPEMRANLYRVEAVLPSSSPLIGHTLNQYPTLEQSGAEIIDLVRNNMGRSSGLRAILGRVREAITETTAASANPSSSPLRDTPLEAGDRLVFSGNKEALFQIKERFGLLFQTHDGAVAEITSSQETEVIEAIILKNSPLVGQRTSDLRLRRRYTSYLLGLYRDGQNLMKQANPVALKTGDVLLLEGPTSELNRFCQMEKTQNLSHPVPVEIDRRKAPLALATLLVVMALAAFNVMDIAGLSLIGATLLIISGAISQDKAFAAIEWKMMLMIYGMLALSQAMEKTGVAQLVVEQAAFLAQGYGPIAVLAVVYFIASALTEVMSNNAVAVLLTPIVIGLAESLGFDPRPLIVAIMFGASASFATPIGYQTNAYVYQAGNYRFKDFLKIGTPMNLITMIVSIVVIPLFWKF